MTHQLPPLVILLFSAVGVLIWFLVGKLGAMLSIAILEVASEELPINSLQQWLRMNRERLYYWLMPFGVLAFWVFIVLLAICLLIGFYWLIKEHFSNGIWKGILKPFKCLIQLFSFNG